jgi:multidrug efflux system membrane fusion protein
VGLRLGVETDPRRGAVVIERASRRCEPQRGCRLKDDINENPDIGPVRLRPAHAPARRYPPRHGPTHPRRPSHAAASERNPTSADGRRLRRIWWAALGSAALLLLIVGLVVVLRRRAAAKKAAAALREGATGAVVTSATAKKGDIGVYLDAIGTVTPVYTASITSQVSGLIVAVHYKEGQHVDKGAPLIDIDPRTYQATLLQAQGALERDQNVLAQAKMDLERYRAAWARNGIAKQVLDDQEKLALQDAGTVKNDEGTVLFDRIQLAYCRIASPIAGRVGLRLVDPGNVVQAGGTTVLAVVAQLTPITVIFTIPEDSLAAVEAGMRGKAALAVEAFDRTGRIEISSGTLLTLDNQIDTQTGTVRARAVFDNASGGLFPNQFVTTRLLVNTLRGVTLVPAAAIQRDGQASFAYVIKDNAAQMRKINPGVSEGGLTQVDGLDPGDLVADSGFDKLQDGTKVAVSSAAPPAPSTADASAAP